MSIQLKAEQVNVGYANFTIRSIDFSLENGSIMGLVGRSGAGKSTIIKALAGLMRVQEGKFTVNMDGEKVSMTSVIGYSPQHNSLYPSLTVMENLMTFGRLQGMSTNDIHDRAQELLKRLNLLGADNKRITQLSGGMRKRADLAVTLIHNPKIIVLDEPFSGLDISLQRFMWNMLHELAHSGKIVVISSHLLTDIKKHCTHFGLVADGEFYNTQEIIQSIKSNGERDFETFLEKLFDKGINMRKHQ